MELIVDRSLKHTEPVLRIDLDKINCSDTNLFLFRSYKEFALAMQSLNKLATELVRKGFINFSKKTGFYSFATALKKLLDKTNYTRPYTKRPIDIESDEKLVGMASLLAQKNELMNRSTGFIRNNPCLTVLKQEPSFPLSRGYKGQMERMIGRPLKDGEQVHHIDHDDHNNFDFNLYLCTDTLHHSTLHYQLNRLLSILIRKGLIHFSFKKGLYSFSRQFERIVNQRSTTPPYRTKSQKTEGKLTSHSLAKVIASNGRKSSSLN